MHSYLCWVCMIDFRQSAELLRHETSHAHLSLLLQQAMNAEGENNARRLRDEKRELLTGVAEQRERELRGVEIAPLGLSFCRCILGWKIGNCATCLETPRDEAALRKRVFKDLVRAKVHINATAARSKTLGRGLQNFFEEGAYDPHKAAAKVGKDESALSKLSKLAKQVARKRLFMSDEERRRRSPLVHSEVRRKSLATVHVLGAQVPRPTAAVGVVLEAPPAAAAVRQLRRVSHQVTARLAMVAAPDQELYSPLRKSTERSVLPPAFEGTSRRASQLMAASAGVFAASMRRKDPAAAAAELAAPNMARGLAQSSGTTTTTGRRGSKMAISVPAFIKAEAATTQPGGSTTATASDERVEGAAGVMPLASTKQHAQSKGSKRDAAKSGESGPLLLSRAHTKSKLELQGTMRKLELQGTLRNLHAGAGAGAVDGKGAENAPPP